MTETVVLVPGIGLGGLDLYVLARLLRKHGYIVKTFWRNPWRRDLAGTAQLLSEMLAIQETEKPHLVAHSLGGLVVQQMLRDNLQQKVGRIVLLGVPLSGCLAARRVMKVPGGRWFIGKALASVATKTDSHFPVGLEIGSIAGNFNFLLGLILCPRKQNDTLVCVEETKHPDVSAHCVLFVSHTSLVLSEEVSKNADCFIRTGAFLVNSEKAVEKL